MNSKQVAALQHITHKVTAAAQMSISKEWMNGPVTFRVEMVGSDVMISASNAGNKEWFETYCYAAFRVGPRGGVMLLDCEGFSKYLITV